MKIGPLTAGLSTVERKLVTDMTADEARAFFMRGDSYFSDDLPTYIDFSEMLRRVADAIKGRPMAGIAGAKVARRYEGVNYRLVTNKDGRWSWRQYELIHPVLYVLLVNLICTEENWGLLMERLRLFGSSRVACAGMPARSTGEEREKAVKITSWWHGVEQESLAASLQYSCLAQSDVQDCYGAMYTHSIEWAILTKEVAKARVHKNLSPDAPVVSLLGWEIDVLIGAGRHGQTNGIPQGTVLMDFIAEIVLGYADHLVTEAIEGSARLKDADVRIIRYRDDYKIFAPSPGIAEEVLRVVSDALRGLGLRLNPSKTAFSSSVIDGAVKEDKLASLELLDALASSKQSLQKQLLRIHRFGREYPNSGAIRRLCAELHGRMPRIKRSVLNAEVEAAIAVDIAMTSPSAFPAVTGILSYILRPLPKRRQQEIWLLVLQKVRTIPHNGYIDLWLQRIFFSLNLQDKFVSEEKLCEVVAGKASPLWESKWLEDGKVLKAMEEAPLLSGDPKLVSPTVSPDELRLFARRLSSPGS